MKRAAAFPEAEYIAALIADLESALPLIWGRPLVSIFFGGGTPSLLSGEALDQLLTAIRTRIIVQPDAEITLEANPGTVEAERFAAYREAGVNRLSLGIQSFNPQHLKALGRIHNGDEARRAIEIAARALRQFQPRPDVRPAAADAGRSDGRHRHRPRLRAAAPLLLPADARTEHRLRRRAAGTARRPTSAPTCRKPSRPGWPPPATRHYETSAFARPGRQCRHNLNYWTFGDYLGIGAGAHGKLTLHDRVLRQMRWKQPKQYLAKIAEEPSRARGEHDVAADDLPFEFMMNALRLTGGVDASLFEARTTLPLIGIEATLRQAEADGLIERGLRQIAPTLRGQRFLNELLRRFLPSA